MSLKGVYRWCRCRRDPGKLFEFVHTLVYQVYSLFGEMYIRARFTAAYDMCDYSGMYV